DIAILASLLCSLGYHVRAGHPLGSMVVLLQDPELERYLPCQRSVVRNVMQYTDGDRDTLQRVLTAVTVGLEQVRLYSALFTPTDELVELYSGVQAASQDVLAALHLRLLDEQWELL
ncbi:unnamed protein product, partial [Symbiodinium natans]